MIVGRELVEFDRRDVPLYQERPSLWAEAGVDTVLYGAPLDRLFGTPGESPISPLHVAAHAPPHDVVLPIVDDPIVELGTLSDALALAEPALGLLDAPLFHDAAVLAPLHDAWSGDNLAADWTFDL